MLAPLCRMTLTVIAALLISFVDGTFDSDGENARSADAPVLLAHDRFDDQDGSDMLSIDLIDQREGGADGVLLRANVGAPGLTCTMRIIYENGGTEVLDDVIADPSGICTSTFAMTGRNTAQHMAEVELEVTNASGALEGETSRAFAIVR